MQGMIGIVGGLILGVLVALFMPIAIVLGAVVIFLIIALLPQMQMLRTFALIALLTMVMVTVISYYVLTDLRDSLSIIGL